MHTLSFNWRRPLRLLILLGISGFAMTVLADEEGDYQAQWGPDVGSQIPELSVQNSSGEPVSFKQLKGENGLALFFVRSSDW